MIEIDVPAGNAWRRPVAAIAVALLCLAAGCATNDRAERATRVAAADAVGSDSGVATGPTGGPPAGTGERRLLDDHERRRLVDAVRVAFAATSEVTTSYTVVPQNIDAEPTIVSAAPAGPIENRADGSTCRPLRLSATKHSHTTIGTLTICRAAGSTELKPATRIQVETSIRSESREPLAAGQGIGPSSSF